MGPEELRVPRKQVRLCVLRNPGQLFSHGPGCGGGGTGPEISIHCGTYIFGEGESSIKRSRTNSISDSFISSLELRYKPGIWELRKGPQKAPGRPAPQDHHCMCRAALEESTSLPWNIPATEAFSFIKRPTPMVKSAELPTPGRAPASPGVVSKNKGFQGLTPK